MRIDQLGICFCRGQLLQKLWSLPICWSPFHYYFSWQESAWFFKGTWIISVLVSHVRSDLKGSTCQCHYCKCERGNLYCLPHHKGFSTFSNGFLDEMSKSIDKLFGLITKKNKGNLDWIDMTQLISHLIFQGKNYCYGPTESEECHCDYCMCRTSFGREGHHHHHPHPPVNYVYWT